MTALDTSLRTYLGAHAGHLSRQAQAHGRLGAANAALEALGITTLGELWGCLHPDPPRWRHREEAARRGLSQSYVGRAARRAAAPSAKVRAQQLARAIGLPQRDVLWLCEQIGKLPRLFQDARPAQAEWFLGHKVRAAQRPLAGWRELEVRSLPGFRVVRRAGAAYILPQLHQRLGGAYDQGARGTCVAQTVGGLVAYLVGFGVSTQFLYHQAKQIDGIPAEEGTYLSAALRVLSDSTLSGPAMPWGSADLGVPRACSWPYDPQPLQGNPAHTPPPSRLREAIYQGERAYNTDSANGIADVLRCSRAKQHIVDDIRFVLATRQVPVAAGFPLYESFNNANSRRTGKITLPLPSESLVGYHAMLIIGFDDNKKAFIVRNSWGSGWAYGCPYAADHTALAGHAVIPYAYFESTRIEPVQAYSLQRAGVARFSVPEQARLYHDQAAPQRQRAKTTAPRQRAVPSSVSRPSFLDFLRLG